MHSLVRSSWWRASAGAALSLSALAAAPALAQAPARAQAQTAGPAASAAAPASSGLARYEAELDAIRRALLSATLDKAPTRVVSTAWIDEHGRLHESAQFASEARVRGVRVLSYLQDPADPSKPPPVEVSAEALPAGLAPASRGDGAECARTHPRWRQPLRLSVQQPLPGVHHPQGHVGQAVLALAGQAWLEAMQPSRRWHVQAPVAPQPATAYERALFGLRDVSSSGWQLQLSVMPLPAPAAEPAPWPRAWGLAAPSQDLVFELRLTLSHALAGPALWQVSDQVRVSELSRSTEPSQWMRALAQDLRTRMVAWQGELDALSACEPVQFELASNGDPWHLQAGALHGVRAGDRLLILNRKQLPQRVLEPGVAQHLALAEVERVGPHSARLRQLAGPALAGRGDWVALPF